MRLHGGFAVLRRRAALTFSCDGVLERAEFVRSPAHGVPPRIDRPADERVVEGTREEVEMQMRQRVAVDLVVHLDRLSNGCDGPSDHHGLVPERSLSTGRHLVWLEHMIAGHHAYVVPQRRVRICGCPARAQLTMMFRVAPDMQMMQPSAVCRRAHSSGSAHTTPPVGPRSTGSFNHCLPVRGRSSMLAARLGQCCDGLGLPALWLVARHGAHVRRDGDLEAGDVVGRA